MHESVTIVAANCLKYEAITSAQGYGFSLLNHLPYIPRCDSCVNWLAGTCNEYVINQRKILITRVYSSIDFSSHRIIIKGKE